MTDLATEIIKYANLRTHIRKINAADSSQIRSIVFIFVALNTIRFVLPNV